LNDRDSDGTSFILKEIDPFTFFATFNRQIKPAGRLEILKGVKEHLGATSPLPDDFSGLPVVNNLRTWFIAHEYIRGKNDVAALWRVFRLALSDNALENPEFAKAFDRALEVWGVATNLTMGLFWIRPEVFLNLDQTNRDYLDIKLPSNGLSADFYINTVRSVKKQGKPLTEISYNAWQAAHSDGHDSSPMLPVENNYWLVNAIWNDRDPADQTPRFLDEGVWQNGYADQHVDDVKSMKVGDRIGIKAPTTQKKGLPFDARGHTVSCMTIKAIGTIVSNRGDGRTVEVEWDSQFEFKQWYFFTYTSKVWRLRRDHYQLGEYAQRLIDFVWRGVPQDYQWKHDGSET
jgi:5-methylcytosine-specific restriction protein B